MLRPKPGGLAKARHPRSPHGVWGFKRHLHCLSLRGSPPGPASVVLPGVQRAPQTELLSPITLLSLDQWQMAILPFQAWSRGHPCASSHILHRPPAGAWAPTTGHLQLRSPFSPPPPGQASSLSCLGPCSSHLTGLPTSTLAPCNLSSQPPERSLEKASQVT